MPNIADGRKIFRIYDFSRGINERVSSYKLLNNELEGCKNVELGTHGSVKLRRGYLQYVQNVYNGRNQPVRGMARYSQADGTRQTVLHAGGGIYADNNDGSFSTVGSMLSHDGYVRFKQWRDALFCYNDRSGIKSYQEGATGHEFLDATADGLMGMPVSDCLWITGGYDTMAYGGTLRETKRYYYRFTFELYHGDTFVGETLPITEKASYYGAPASRGVQYRKNKYWQLSFDTTIYSPGAVDDRYWIAIYGATFQDLPWNINPSGLADYAHTVKYINVYRTPALDTEEVVNEYDDYPNFFYVGSIDVADYDIEQYLLLDTGAQISEDTLTYGIVTTPPKPRFMAAHKNRMWSGHVRHEWQEGSEDYHPYRVYFSEFLQPWTYRETSWLDITPEDGEPITGILSWNNKALIIFKENSMHAILGGDEEIVVGDPGIYLETIDYRIGCVAPETITVGEGAIFWLSNRGVYYYDGTTPKPLMTENIMDTLDDINDDRKYNAVMRYLGKYRQLWLCISTNSDDPSKNRRILKYDFYVGAWAKDLFYYGISSLIEFERGYEATKVIFGAEHASPILLTGGNVFYIADIFFDNIAGNDTPISWFIKTKFFDCGSPELDKEFVGAFVQVASPHPVTLDYFIDNKIDTEASGEGLTLESSGLYQWDMEDPDDPPNLITWDGGATWGGFVEGEKYRNIPTVTGKRIAFKISGSAHLSQVEIQGISIVYKEKARLKSA